MTVILDDGERLADLPRDASTAARVVRIDGYADLRYYQHPLPALTEIGGSAFLRDYAHIPAWIGQVGEDERGFSFWADLTRHRIRGACYSFTPEQALAYWGPGGQSDRPDCLALAQKAIALAERVTGDRS